MEEEVVAELGLSDTLPVQWSDTLGILEVRPARGGPTHTLEARRWREKKERPLAMIWEKDAEREGGQGTERIPGKKGRLRRGGDEKSLVRGEQTRER